MNADLNVAGALTLGAIVNTGSNTLGLGCLATVSGASASSYIRGNVKKDYCATGGFTYPTGTANGYSPASANVTTLTVNPSSLTVKAVQGAHPNVSLPNNRLQRYWTLTEGGDLTANLLFSYLASDITGLNESAFKVFKIESGVVTNQGGTTDAVAHTAGITGITAFSDWTTSDPAAPTASGVSVSGAVLTQLGRPVRAATVVLTDVSGQAQKTKVNRWGDYSFTDVEPGQTYFLSVFAQGFNFQPPTRVVAPNFDQTGLDFTAIPIR